MSVMRTLAIMSGIVLPAVGCRSFQSVEPGHVALVYEPGTGLQRTLIPVGRVELGWLCWLHTCSRLYDFDVTFSTTHEQIQTTSADHLPLWVNISVIYRPVINELYELETELGQDYYKEVVGPELRGAAGAVLASHPYGDIAGKTEQIEDEIEADVRRRIKGRHVELASVVIENETTRSPSCP